LAFLIGLIFAPALVNAQATQYYTDIQNNLSLARELFRNAKYNAAYREFEKIKDKADEKSEIASEAYYYMSLSALRSGHVTGEKMLANFLKDYADSPFANYATFYLGEYQYDKKRWQLVTKTLAGVDRDGLSESDRIKCGYMAGYSYMMTEENDLALNEFIMIKDKNHILAKPSLYYWAHINYLKGNYEDALEGFRQLEGDPRFSKVIPMYVSQIYYKQERYADVVGYIVPIINQVEEAYKPELAKIIGDSYFHLNRYTDALQFLEYYHETPGTKSREDNYIMAYCLYATQQFAKAVPFFEKSSKGNDLMAQNSFYHLADAYIQTGQKEKARISFEAASELEFDDKIREDALFNYAKLTYELSYSPFNETIKAFDKYITMYPNSERNTAAYQYLVEVFMVTKNYRDAISSIEKIKVRNTELNRAYQRVTFYRGLELFHNQAYEQAIENFDKSLRNNHTAPIYASTLFWKSEALYRIGDYNSAITGFTKFIQTPGASAVTEYYEAYYSLGYSYFKLEDYRQAGTAFRKYQAAMSGRRSNKVADVHNRIGDTYFIARDYQEAVRNYQQAFNMKIYDADYALYRMAFCSGLQRNQEAKIAQLRNLISSFPQSAYADDAHFELARSYERDAKYNEAKREYQVILDRYKESSYFPKALLQMGLVHYNLEDYSKSLEYYKQVAEQYGGTQEAQSALMGIKNCYIEMNNPEAYFTYANKLGNTSYVTTSEQDSLTYITAEKMFMAGDPDAINRLNRYLQQFPNGSFVLNTHFYLGEALYNNKRYTESLDHYLFVAKQPLNVFSEPALSKTSEMLFNAKRYTEALENFDRLGTISNNQWNKVKAMAGKMRCNYLLERYRDAIEAAGQLRKAEKNTDALIREAGYISAKSYYLLGNYDASLPLMTEAASESNTVQGAEANFLVADIYFRKQNLAGAEKQIMTFIDKGTSHQFWLAKSFLLLADIYIARKDDFQARHTLKSLSENYPVQDDGILKEAGARLVAIDSREKAEQEQQPGNPMQIDLNQQ
jgi:TolA-binding protein